MACACFACALGRMVHEHHDTDHLTPHQANEVLFGLATVAGRILSCSTDETIVGDFAKNVEEERNKAQSRTARQAGTLS